MIAAPVPLDPTIEQAIRQLETLAGCFAEQLPSVGREVTLSPAQRVSKELLISISVLLPKLRQARGYFAAPTSAARSDHMR